jgi:hypothetical protein
MQKRMLDAVAGIPGVESVGLSDPLLLNDTQSADVFSDQTTDLRRANAAANVYMFHVSPDYLRTEGTTLLGGRDFTWHDDKNAPRVAIVNREFPRKLFGSTENGIGGYFKMPDGTRVQVVGITENGKYSSLTEDPYGAMFLPILQSPSSSAFLVVRSNRDPGFWARRYGTLCTAWMRPCRLTWKLATTKWSPSYFPLRWQRSRWV